MLLFSTHTASSMDTSAWLHVLIIDSHYQFHGLHIITTCAYYQLMLTVPWAPQLCLCSKCNAQHQLVGRRVCDFNGMYLMVRLSTKWQPHNSQTGKNACYAEYVWHSSVHRGFRGTSGIIWLAPNSAHQGRVAQKGIMAYVTGKLALKGQENCQTNKKCHQN